MSLDRWWASRPGHHLAALPSTEPDALAHDRRRGHLAHEAGRDLINTGRGQLIHTEALGSEGAEGEEDRGRGAGCLREESTTSLRTLFPPRRERMEQGEPVHGVDRCGFERKGASPRR